MHVASKVVPAVAAAMAGICAQMFVTVAAAQSLEDTLAAAYRNNPALEAARVRLRATDEEVPLAWSGYHPIIRADAIVARRRIETELEGDAIGGEAFGLPDGSALGGSTDAGISSPRGWQVTGRQTVFDGFRTKGAIGRANETVRAGRAELSALEAQVLLDAATAHLDIVRDHKVFEIRRNFVSLLERELSSVKRRRAAQEATNADVATTEARLADARGNVAAAEANLLIARARYADVVGEEAGSPRAVKSFGRELLPTSLSDALQRSRSASPAIAAAYHRERAAAHAVTEADSALLPQVTIEGSYSEVQDPSEGVRRTSEGLIYGRVSVPIYEAGATHIRARQSRHERIARGEDIRSAETASIAETKAAWQSLTAARALLAASQARETAAAQALAGIRREASVGARTQIDILNAEQEVLSARIARAAALRDKAVAQAALLKAVGHLDAASVSNVVVLYDAEGHLEVAKRKWIGLDVEPAGAWQVSVVASDEADPAPLGASAPAPVRAERAQRIARPSRSIGARPAERSTAALAGAIRGTVPPQTPADDAPLRASVW